MPTSSGRKENHAEAAPAATRMRVAIGQLSALTPDKVSFAQQLGVTSLQMNTPKLPDRGGRWDFEDVRELFTQASRAGLHLECIENVPLHFYDAIITAKPGDSASQAKRESQLDNFEHTMRAIRRAGVGTLGFHWMPSSVWRTGADSAVGRGGARVTAFDTAVLQASQGAFLAKRDHDKVDSGSLWVWEDMGGAAGDAAPPLLLDDEQMWSNYQYFIERVVPVAHEIGLRLALHPDDPPVPELGGVARLFRSPENFRRAEEIADALPGGAGAAWGLDLCLGCCSEMPGGAQTVMEMIEHFGKSGKIFYVHFRDVKGTVDTPGGFSECFIGEGNYDPAKVMLALHRVGFAGFLIDDHVPHMVDDTDWQHRGRAHAIGLMQGILRTIDALDP